MFGNALLTGIACGAGAMYFFDAQQGTGRRKKLADQFNRFTHRTLRDLDASWRDLSNRASGTVAEAQGMFRSDHASDEVICNRVRSSMGHVVSNPGAIEVGCHNGHVVLRGPAFRSEMTPLLRTVGLVRGVRTVADELVVHDEGSPGARGLGAQQPLSRARTFQRDLAPGTKLLMGTVGGALLANCMMSRRRGIADYALGALGFGMLVRAISTRNVGYRLGQQVQFHKTLEINAPVDKVFDFFRHEENLPLISDKVREVQPVGDDCFVKSMAMPGGIELRLSERLFNVQPEECICACSEPDSMVQYDKKLNFESEENRTRVHMQFSYSPPAGAIGHAAAAAFGLDAKTFFDDLMMRAKTYLETGIQPHDAAKRMVGQEQRQGQPTQAQAAAPSGATEQRPEATSAQHAPLTEASARTTLAQGSGVPTSGEFARKTDAGANVPPHEAAPEIAGVAETDQIGPVDRDLDTYSEAERAAMRNHI